MFLTLKKTVDQVRQGCARQANFMLRRPSNMLLFLTYRCTSRCLPCTMWQRPTRGEELSLEAWKAFFDAARGRYPINHVEMFGGDALLRRDVLVPFARHVKDAGIGVDVSVNGNLLNAGYARELVESGLDLIYVSCDGVGELHDRIRGVPGTFQRVRDGLAYLAQAKEATGRHPQIVVNCTVSGLNAHAFDGVLDFAVEMKADKAAFEYVGEFPPAAVSSSCLNGLSPEPYFVSREGKSLLANPADARLIKEKIRVIKQRARALSIKVNTINIDNLSVEQLVTGRMPNRRCYIARTQIIADPYGNVMPCPFFNTYAIGNIKDAPIDKIWNNETHRKFIEHADAGRIGLCRHCILGVERNPGFLDYLERGYRRLTRKGKGEE